MVENSAKTTWIGVEFLNLGIPDLHNTPVQLPVVDVALRNSRHRRGVHISIGTIVFDASETSSDLIQVKTRVNPSLYASGSQEISFELIPFPV